MPPSLPLTRAARDLSPKGEVGSIAALSARLRRPADAWPALAELDEAQLALLAGAIDDAAARQSSALETALRRTLSPPLSAMILARLRRRRT